MDKAGDFSWNEDMDEQRIADAISNLNQRLENLKTNAEQDFEEGDDRKPIWPSFTGRM